MFEASAASLFTKIRSPRTTMELRFLYSAIEILENKSTIDSGVRTSGTIMAYVMTRNVAMIGTSRNSFVWIQKRERRPRRKDRLEWAENKHRGSRSSARSTHHQKPRQTVNKCSNRRLWQIWNQEHPPSLWRELAPQLRSQKQSWGRYTKISKAEVGPPSSPNKQAGRAHESANFGGQSLSLTTPWRRCLQEMNIPNSERGSKFLHRTSI